MGGLRYRAGKGWFLLGRRWRRRDSLTRDRSGDRLLGRYELLRSLSRGGFSVVYEARDEQRAGARIAVKILTATEGQEGSMRDQFLQEVAALRSVEHEGVVSVLDSWVEPTGEPCLAMPFLDGPTLRTVLGAGVLPPERVSRLALRLGSAIQAVHERGVVHRDIKPENIVVLHAGTLDEQPVLIDFGTAGLRAGGDGLALTTLLGGSLAYLAPERLGGYYSTASDLYSFAVVVLEMLTGKRPAEMGVVFAEGETTGRLAQCLENVGAEPVTDLLIAAFHPNPARRPSRVADWAREVAVALNQR
jgi:serine/threonine-protein kinase